MSDKKVRVSKHDINEVMKFQTYLTRKDTSADLKEVYRRLAEKYNMEFCE